MQSPGKTKSSFPVTDWPPAGRESERGIRDPQESWWKSLTRRNDRRGVLVVFATPHGTRRAAGLFPRKQPHRGQGQDSHSPLWRGLQVGHRGPHENESLLVIGEPGTGKFTLIATTFHHIHPAVGPSN
jgi:hypothetical protein